MTSISLSDDAALLVIDVQKRLMKAMDADQMERCIHATHTLIELAGECDAPIIYTEQYPDGLGPTEDQLLEALQKYGAARVEKKAFDACSSPNFRDQLIEMPKRVIVCGMETHVCVYTTVRELIEHRHEVVVPFDATISRRQAHHHNGLQLIEGAGATVANYETLVFDALGSSEHPAFKRFSKMVK